MANVRNGNTYYIDEADKKLSTSDNIKVCFIVLSKITSGAGSFQLKDGSTTGDKKITVEIPENSVETIDLNTAPMIFPNGIYTEVVDSGVVVTLFLKESGG